MDNLKLPSYSVPNTFALDEKGNLTIPMNGFTKLELASLMIAQGMMVGAWAEAPSDKQVEYIKETSVIVAKAVLEETNK